MTDETDSEATVALVQQLEAVLTASDCNISDILDAIVAVERRAIHIDHCIWIDEHRDFDPAETNKEHWHRSLEDLITEMDQLQERYVELFCTCIDKRAMVAAEAHAGNNQALAMKLFRANASQQVRRWEKPNGGDAA